MSFPDHPPPPPPFLPPPSFASGNFRRQNPIDNDDDDSNPHLNQLQSLKRPRTINNNPQMSNPPNFPRTNTPNPLLNRGTGYIFYKTRMCLKFLDGNCRNGENCTFAHGADDLREPPPNWQEIVGRKENGNNFDDPRIMHRFKICKKYANGEECPYGENCNFLHKRAMVNFEAEVDGPRESSAIRIGTNGPPMAIRNVPDQIEVAVNNIDNIDNNKDVVNGSEAFRVNMKPAYWKTKLCSKFEITGNCPFGEKCHFAHGQEDLQQPGARIEAEAMGILSSTPSPAQPPVFIPTTAAPATEIINNAFVDPTTELRIKKCSEKWKGPKKINSIYADWLDDLTPPLMYPKNIED